MTFATDRANMQTYVTSTTALAQGYLDRLVTQADNLIVTGTTELPERYDYASIPQVNFPLVGASRPSDIALIGAAPPPETPAYAFSPLVAITLPIDDLLAPTAQFVFYEAAYESTLLDPLKAKLLADLTNGGYGIDTADEVALFNRARDREVELALTRIEDAGRTMASRGFPLPPGELSIHVDRAWQDMQNKVSDVSRDITLQRNKLFVENRQFTIREVRELEQITMNYWNSVQERAFNVARVAGEFGILVYNTLLARYKARLDAAKINADVQYQVSQAQVAQALAAFDSFRGQIVAYEANLRRLLDTARLSVDVYGHDVAAVRATNDGTVARAQLQQEVIKSTTQQNIQISQMTVENAKARITGVVESLRFKTAAAQFGSSAFFAQLTAIINAVNSLSVETVSS